MKSEWKTTTEKKDGITTTSVEPIPQPKTGNQLEIIPLAYEFWQARGCPDGTPEEDWFRAEEELENRTRPALTAGASGR